MAAQKRKITQKKVSIPVAVVLALFVSFFVLQGIDEWLNLGLMDKIESVFSPFENTESDEKIPDSADFQVHFIDVGQGDAVLIRSDGYNILIDAGENDKGQTVVSYLKKQGIQKLDMVIATHPHSDHIGGLDVVIDNLDVKQVLMPKLKKSVVPTTKTYRDFLSSIKNKGLTATVSKPGQIYTFGNGKLTVIGPVKDYDDLNNTSLVARFDYGSKSIMLTGDMERISEKDILSSGADVSADILKLGHHGSSTSNSDAFFKAVNPSFCVACCGEDNDYGHPHKETLARVKKYGVELYRTDYQGSVVFSMQDGKLTVVKQKG